MDENEPIARAAYDRLAHAYAARAETKAENGYNEHPAMRKALGDVSGMTVLEAGCGPGFLVRDLLAAGAARVVAFDVSSEMIKLTRERVGTAHAEVFVHDLANPLTHLADNSFDLVASSLAIDYVRDWSTPLGEFFRLLKPGGRLVFSVQHPMGAYKWYDPPSAFGVHLCEAPWRGFTPEPVVMPDYYRSFEEIFNPLLAAGFVLQRVIETKPVEALRAVDPERLERHSRFPTFMILETRKPSTA